MKRSMLQDHLARTVGICLGMGGGIWLYCLIAAAISVRDYSGGFNYDIRLGPMLLHTLSKQQLPDGSYAISLSLESDVIWYATTCCTLGAIWGVANYLYLRRNSNKE